MTITIYGGKKPQRELLENMAVWLSNELLGPRMANNVDVDIVLKKFSCKEEKGFRGFMMVEDCNIRPRHFLIEIEKFQTDDDLMETLAHEFVHVKQDVRGQTKERHRGGFKMYWMGEDHTNTPYQKQPWEKEAFSLEKRLVRRYKKSL
jgi:hypothetical protein